MTFDINTIRFIINLNVITLVATLCSYHLFIFMGRHKEKTEYSSFFLFFAGLTFIFNIILSTNQEFNRITGYLIELNIFFNTLFVVLTIRSLVTLPKLSSNILFIIVTILCFLSILSFPTLFLGIDWYYKWYFLPGTLIQITLAIVLIFTIITSILCNKELRSTNGSKIIFIAFCVMFLNYIVGAVARIFDTEQLNLLKGNYTLAGIFYYLLSYAISGKFNKEYEKLRQLTNYLQEEIDKATYDIRTQKESNKRFFISFAHEIKSPLTTMLNALYDLKGKIKFHTELLTLESSLKKIVRDVTHFLDAEKFDYIVEDYEESTIIDLTHLVREKYRQYNLIAEQKKQKKFIDHIAPYLFVKSHPVVIERIIDNLISNADKYTDFGAITIILKKGKKDTLIFEVSDTGKGIAESEFTNIFREYYQIEHSFYKGTGMGLYITKKYVESLKGAIEVKSSVDKGSTFTVTLPAYTLKKNEEAFKITDLETPPLVYEETDEKDPLYNGKKPVILIVEDDIQIRNLLKKHFQDDYSVYCADNGKHALVKLKNIPIPRLILSDIMMEKMDGEQFIKHLEEHYSDIPVIFITAKTEKDNKNKTLALGAVDYITKPFNIEEIKLKVRSHINKRLAQENRRNIPPGIRDEQTVYECIEKKNSSFKLSPKERKYLTLYLLGKNNLEITRIMNIPAERGRTFKSRIKSKLGTIDHFKIASLYGLTS